MSYPQEILPTPNHKWIECPTSDLFLIRHFDWNEGKELFLPGTEDIDIHYICTPEHRIEDLSMSLFGVYTENHINLTFTDLGGQRYYHYCQPDENVPVPVLEEDFTDEDGRRGYWCVPMNKLAGLPFSFTRGKDQLTATCRVVHTPMRWNYWHHSLRWDISTGPLEEITDAKLRENIARRIGHSVRAAISHFAKSTVPASPVLAKTCYCIN